MFDPFESRTSRNIRNQLSEIFISALSKKTPAPIGNTVHSLKKTAPDPDHHNYIDERLRRYNLILTRLPSCNPARDPLETARLLWNQNLFFECHEWLEPFWTKASGPRKKAIQGLIRAAGAFVLLEAGRLSAAESSAQKAIALVEDHGEEIRGFHTEKLIRALKALSPTTFPD